MWKSLQFNCDFYPYRKSKVSVKRNLVIETLVDYGIYPNHDVMYLVL